MDTTMHMRILGKLDSGKSTVTIYRCAGGHEIGIVALVIIEDPKAEPESLADAICEAMDAELAARRVN